MENLIKNLKKISLTPKEKSAIFAKLDAHIQAGQPVKSHWMTSGVSMYGRVVTYSLLGLTILIITGGSVVWSSDQALPGDLLYPLKVNFSEPLRVAVTVTPETKEYLEIKQLEERVVEAEILSLQGRLTTTTAVELKQAVENKIKSVKDGEKSKERKKKLDEDVKSAKQKIKKEADRKSKKNSRKSSEDR